MQKTNMRQTVIGEGECENRKPGVAETIRIMFKVSAAERARS